jgi:glucosamine kinase
VAAPLFLGVDGGGTHTRARVRDAEGRLLGESMGGPGNARLGERARREVMAVSRAALAAAAVGEADFSRVRAGFGLAGTQQQADHDAVMAWPVPFASLVVDTDAGAAWWGAFGGADGAILILGTGSCGLTVTNGVRATVGGWGAELADEGSGFAIGRAALRMAVRALDGMAEKTPLLAELLAAFDHSADRAVAWATRAVPGDYAAFAPAVFAHAGRGDPVAVAVIAEAAAGATLMIDRLTELGARRIAMIGGVFPPIRRWLPDRVQPLLVEPGGDAMDGAMMMAGLTTVVA